MGPQSPKNEVARKKVTNCRGNPPWLPILRAATGGRPYNIFSSSGLAGLGFFDPPTNPYSRKVRGDFSSNSERG
jgi:hypothetical protein